MVYKTPLKKRKYQKNYYQENKNKVKAYQKEHRRLHPNECKDRGRRNYIRRTYGLTPEQYNQMLEDQGYKCEICRGSDTHSRTDRLNVDHCHKTKRNRGLLCYRCNTMLGMALDNTEILQNAIDYLRKYRG